jgi:hypothetical protein
MRSPSRAGKPGSGAGKVIGECFPRKRAVEFRKLLDAVDAELPSDLEVHLVVRSLRAWRASANACFRTRKTDADCRDTALGLPRARGSKRYGHRDTGRIRPDDNTRRASRRVRRAATCLRRAAVPRTVRSPASSRPASRHLRHRVHQAPASASRGFGRHDPSIGLLWELGGVLARWPMTFWRAPIRQRVRQRYRDPRLTADAALRWRRSERPGCAPRARRFPDVLARALRVLPGARRIRGS